MANEQDTLALQEELRKLRQDVAFARTEIRNLQQNQLRFPVDSPTQTTVNGLIDTRLNSILYNTLWKKTFHWYEPWDAISGWEQIIPGAGTITLLPGAVELKTAAAAGDAVIFAKKSLNYSVVNPTGYDSSFRISFLLKDTPASSIISLSAGDAFTAGNNYYGFVIKNGNIYGEIAAGSPSNQFSNTNLLGTVTNWDETGEIYVLEARYYAGVKVDFFITVTKQGVAGALSSVPVATIPSTISIPSYVNVKNLPYTFTFALGTDDAAAKVVWLLDLDYIQRLTVQ